MKPVRRLILAMSIVLPLVPSSATAQPERMSSAPPVYIFGDSVSDVGNFTAVRGKNPPPWDPDRFSNGRLWVDFVAKTYHTSIEASSQGGTNYAVAGATIDPASTFLPNSSGIDQALMYIARGPDPSAVHIVFIGSNDLVSILAGASAEQAASAASAKLETMLALLANNGVNHLWVATLPNLGDAPFWSMFGLEPFREVFRRATVILNAEIRRLVIALHVCDPRVIELDQVQEEIIANPHQFGFKNVTDACWAIDGSVCSDPSSYYWFQASHPSERAHFAWSLAFTREARDFARRCEAPGR